MPRLRLATCTASGLVRVPIVTFMAWRMLAVMLTVTPWTADPYGLSADIGQALARHLGQPPALAVAMPIVVLAAAVLPGRHLRTRLTTARP